MDTDHNWLKLVAHCVFVLWGLFRIRELFPGTEIEMFAHFTGESLKKTKTREFVPSQEEIMALVTRQEMTTTVYCHGGGSCKISINSHTTAGEVVSRHHGSILNIPPKDMTVITHADIGRMWQENELFLMHCCYLCILCPGGGEADQRSGYGGQQEHVCTL